MAPEINQTPVYIGTSGYNHDDWIGTFVPENVEKYDLLNYYVKSGLNFLELTYTFYKIPLADKIAGILERTGSDVKLSIRLTKSLLRKMPDKSEIEAFKKGIAPAVEAGNAVALFADFHHLFQASIENFDILRSLRDNFSDVPLFFELPSGTWHKEQYYEKFIANEMGMCVIDATNISGYAPYKPICSGNGVYFRLYGKNPARLSPNAKILDYSYSERELKRFIEDAKMKSVLAKNIFFSFCNVAKGQAPINALTLKKLIEEAGE